MRKFLITGTTSSGKTTLLNSVSSLFKRTTLHQDIGIVREVARPLLRLHPEYETNPLFQELLFMAQVGREAQAATRGYHYLLCDRGSLDIIVFSQVFGHPIQSEWVAHLQQYEAIFVCQPDFELQVTPLQQQVSQRDWQEFRLRWQAQLFSTLEQLQLQSVVLEGQPDIRVKRFLEELSYRHQSVEGGSYAAAYKEQ